MRSTWRSCIRQEGARPVKVAEHVEFTVVAVAEPAPETSSLIRAARSPSACTPM